MRMQAFPTRPVPCRRIPVTGHADGRERLERWDMDTAVPFICVPGGEPGIHRFSAMAPNVQGRNPAVQGALQDAVCRVLDTPKKAGVS